METPPKTLKSRLVLHSVNGTEPGKGNVEYYDSLPAARDKDQFLKQAGEMLPGEAGESLPVLRAFEEFLESQRREARKRMLGMTVFFAVVMLIAIAGAGAAGFFLLSHFEADMQDMQNDVARMKEESLILREQTQHAIQRFGNDTGGLRDTLSRNKEAVSRIKSEMGVKSATYDRKLSRISDVVEMIKVENEKLRKALSDIQSSRSEAAVSPEAGPPESGAVDRETNGEIAGDRRAYAVLKLSIEPAGSAVPSVLRLAIPE
ncbi:MAG: hypothetical protein R6V03_10720 [Kiritimatiellia bacterium]